jgi:hypothetical protein
MRFPAGSGSWLPYDEYVSLGARTGTTQSHGKVECDSPACFRKEHRPSGIGLAASTSVVLTDVRKGDVVPEERGNDCDAQL